MSGAPVSGAPVTVAVVSWNTRELLERCLASLAPEVAAGRAAVWVVDNGSSDGSAAAARRAAPWAQVVEAPGNLGFGTAVNLVAARTASPWLLAANADVALRPGALQALLDAGRGVDVGCVAPRLLLPGGATEHSVHPFPTLALSLAFNLGLHRLSPRVAERLCLEGRWDPSRPRRVPWAIGACLLLRRHAFDAAGGFDERQWMYAEDLDLAWRLRDLGFAVRFEPRALVDHQSGAATAPAFGAGTRTRFMRETYRVLRRRRGPATALSVAALNVLGALLRLSWMVPAALILRRWRGPARDAGWWLVAHLRGLAAAARGYTR